MRASLVLICRRLGPLNGTDQPNGLPDVNGLRAPHQCSVRRSSTLCCVLASTLYRLGDKRAKPRDATLHPVVPRMAAAQAQAIGKSAAGREHFARREANAFLERALEQWSGFHLGWQLEPQHEAASRAAHPRGGRKTAVDGACHRLDVVGEYAANAAKMAVVAARCQELRKSRLRQHRTAECESRLGVQDARQMPAGCDPTDAIAGRDRLRE